MRKAWKRSCSGFSKAFATSYLFLSSRLSSFLFLLPLTPHSPPSQCLLFPELIDLPAAKTNKWTAPAFFLLGFHFRKFESTVVRIIRHFLGIFFFFFLKVLRRKNKWQNKPFCILEILNFHFFLFFLLNNWFYCWKFPDSHQIGRASRN